MAGRDGGGGGNDREHRDGRREGAGDARPERDSLDDLAARRGLDRDIYAPAEDSALLAAAALDHL